MKAGIMGGTFDPIHIGHLILGEAALRQFHLDQIYFMPAGNPPHKKERLGRATDEQRIRMVQLAIRSNPNFRLSLVEMNDQGYTYTYKTLQKLRTAYPENDYYFIIGADSLQDFHEWMEPQKIADQCHIVAATRNQMPPEEFDRLLETQKKRFRGDFLKLDTPNLDISSKHLRKMVREGESIRYYVRDEVMDYIQENGLYLHADEEGAEPVY
ncbi:MAG: nicotinate-nucleotide adenylyltransferase [Eubacterium sp.]|nr:nicotinate-nucleotide adenylyltransferase [Eubacterium sp.]